MFDPVIQARAIGGAVQEYLDVSATPHLRKCG
jgi:hypothetical protein